MQSSLISLVPGCLVASPSLRDPNFDHAVVMLCVHNQQGAMGLVINRLANVTTKQIMSQMSIPCTAHCDKTALLGGPIAIENGLLLYQGTEYTQPREHEMHLGNGLWLCSCQRRLREIGEGRGPHLFEIFLGHAGWGPGQLEQEISRGVWIPTRFDKRLIFSVEIAHRWEFALQLEGLRPAQISTYRPAS